MLTGLRLRVYESLANMSFLRKRAIRKQWKAFAMADSEGKAVEFVQFRPTGHGIATGVRPIADKKANVEMWAQRVKLVYPDTPFHFSSLSVVHLKPGDYGEAEMIPSFMPLAFTRVQIREDSIMISQRGIGGAPAGLRLLGSAARKTVETPLQGGGSHFDMEFPLYRKVVIGLDDTDSATKGATVMVAMQIGNMLGKALKGVEFLRRGVTFNWPDNPYKTTNNASSVLVFAARPERVEELIEWSAKLARKYTISEDTGMAAISMVRMPEELKSYSRKVKRELVDVSETHEVAKQVGARLIPIKGESSRGLIGALSAIGLVDQPREAFVPVRGK